VTTTSSGWYVYMLRCRDGSLYTGITTDLERRLHEHNHGRRGARYTRARRPVTLVWAEPQDTRADAMRREYHLRNLGADAKRSLIAGSTLPPT
jgi:putative endonuclease